MPNIAWLDWGKRLRLHVRETKTKSWGQIAEHMDVTEGAVRHWCNGTRDINLKEFFQLCQFVDANPMLILFGRLPITDDMKKRLGDAVSSVLESDPAINPHYSELIGNIQKDMRKRKKGAR